MTTKEELDNTDKVILDILQKNARITNVELANKIGLSNSSTLERVKKLELSGFIEGYYTKISEEKLGLANTIIMRIKLNNITKEKLTEFTEYIKGQNEVTEVYQIIGEANFLIKASFENLKSYREFLVCKLYNLNLIENVSSDIIIDTIKCAEVSLI